jgi:hypothetical protein
VGAIAKMLPCPNRTITALLNEAGVIRPRGRRIPDQQRPHLRAVAAQYQTGDSI